MLESSALAFVLALATLAAASLLASGLNESKHRQLKTH